MIIRQAAARILDKKPEKLTRTDLAEITELHLNNPGLSDITFLEKLTNLKKLTLFTGDLTKPASLPGLIAIMEKLHLYKKPGNKFLDISILEKLPNLETLTLSGRISDSKSIGRLKNLKELNIESLVLFDMEPLKDLQRLEILLLSYYPTLSLEPIGKLSNLQELTIYYGNYGSGYGSLSGYGSGYGYGSLSGYGSGYGYGPLSGYGSGYGGQSINLEPLKELTNLRKLKLKNHVYGGSGYPYSFGSGNVYGYFPYGYGYPGYNYNGLGYAFPQQIEDLQKALPDLEIEW